jgi:RNA polymerase sigma-70 factor (ECF subfamily)
MERTDAALVIASQAGDLAAFEALYERHKDWVLSLAFRFCGNREDALDVLQETFVYFLKKLPSLELRSQLRTFLYPAVKHLAFSRKQSARRQVSLESAPDPPARDKEPDEIGHLLHGLSDQHREVVWMRFADGLDLKEIAEALGIPLGTVKSRLHGALEALRRLRRGR